MLNQPIVIYNDDEKNAEPLLLSRVRVEQLYCFLFLKQREYLVLLCMKKVMSWLYLLKILLLLDIFSQFIVTATKDFVVVYMLI